MFHLKLDHFPTKNDKQNTFLFTPNPKGRKGRQTNHVAPVEDPACLLSAEGKGVENKHVTPR